MGIYTARTYSGGGIGSGVGYEVIGLVIAVVAVYLLPVFTSFVINAEGTISGNNLTVTARFGPIITLIFSLLPLLVTIGIVGLTLYSGVRGVRGSVSGQSSGSSYAM